LIKKGVIRVVEDSSVGINNVNESLPHENTTYDLSGKKVENGYKGAFISNGKKIIKR